MKKRLNDRNQWAVGSGQWATFVHYGQIILLLILLFSCSSKETTEKDAYTCPMHPTVVADKPGNCPVCGMDLVRKARAGEEVKMTEELAQLIQSTNEEVVANIKTVKGTYQSLSTTTKVQGVVTYDTRLMHDQSVRFSGRLEQVAIKSLYQYVKKGQKLASIYSPELITAQRELIDIIKNDPSNQSLIDSAKSKLSLLGISAPQLNELIQKQTVTNTFPIYSDHEGYVITMDVNAESAPSTMNEGSAMGNTPATASTVQTRNDLLRSGDYVTTGQTLFKVADVSALRVELLFPSTATINTFHLQDEVELMINGNPQKARIDFIQPFTNKGEEMLRLRVYTKSIEQMKVGQFIQATIPSQSKEGLWLPLSSVVDIGLQQIVFIKDRGAFLPKTVTVLNQTKDQVEVKGITSADEIASDGHYLIDSENLIKSMN